MFSSIFLLFCLSAMVASYTPGPAVMLARQNSALHGWRHTALSSLGNITGLMILGSASAIGLGTVLRASATLFLLLKLAGAGYLIYLGVRQWRARGGGALPEAPLRQRARQAGIVRYREGLLLALSNPKAILFITALFPQFIERGQPLLPQWLAMTLAFMAISFCALMSYATAGQLARYRLSATLASPRFRRATGSLFVLMGLGLLTLRRQ